MTNAIFVSKSIKIVLAYAEYFYNSYLYTRYFAQRYSSFVEQKSSLEVVYPQSRFPLKLMRSSGIPLPPCNSRGGVRERPPLHLTQKILYFCRCTIALLQVHYE